MAARRFHLSKRALRGTILAVIIAGWFFFGGWLSRGLQMIEIPFVRYATWITQRVGIFQDARHVTSAQMQTFEDQQIAFFSLEARVHALEAETTQLKKTLGFVEGRMTIPLGASILSRTMSNEQSRLVINRGSDDGVLVGFPVIVEDGLYVGKVIEVSNTQSIVSTVTDHDHATAVSLLNETRTIGLAHGLNGNLTMIDFIPLDESIEVDRLVVTSGLEQYVSSGLLVGFINTVRPDPSGPFQQAIVEPLVDIRRYTDVIILLPKTV